jgi:hypothetical protein
MSRPQRGTHAWLWLVRSHRVHDRISDTVIVAKVFVARFRLRFLLQELDLVGPVIRLGRSSECQITLEDPLVSRVHAELTVSDSGVIVRDLGSRNGVRVNGELIEGEAALKHDDRLRLGSLDLVFLALEGTVGEARMPRATGSMARCKGCERPFPSESASCPRCGASKDPFPRGNGPETVTGIELGDAPSWTFRLIAEVIERALTAGRAPEAERMLERAARDIDQRVARGKKLGHEQLSEASRFALRLAKLQQQPAWALWALSLYRSEQVTPSPETLDLVESLDTGSLQAVRPELETLLRDRSSQVGASPSAAERAGEQRIDGLARSAG